MTETRHLDRFPFGCEWLNGALTPAWQPPAGAHIEQSDRPGCDSDEAKSEPETLLSGAFQSNTPMSIPLASAALFAAAIEIVSVHLKELIIPLGNGLRDIGGERNSTASISSNAFLQEHQGQSETAESGRPDRLPDRVLHKHTRQEQDR